jgi:hypothetical protein
LVSEADNPTASGIPLKPVLNGKELSTEPIDKNVDTTKGEIANLTIVLKRGTGTRHESTHSIPLGNFSPLQSKIAGRRRHALPEFFTIYRVDRNRMAG